MLRSASEHILCECRRFGPQLRNISRIDLSPSARARLRDSSPANAHQLSGTNDSAVAVRLGGHLQLMSCRNICTHARTQIRLDLAQARADVSDRVVQHSLSLCIPDHLLAKQQLAGQTSGKRAPQGPVLQRHKACSNSWPQANDLSSQPRHWQQHQRLRKIGGRVVNIGTGGHL